jgi:hypothetical protein
MKKKMTALRSAGSPWLTAGKKWASNWSFQWNWTYATAIVPLATNAAPRGDREARDELEDAADPDLRPDRRPDLAQEPEDDLDPVERVQEASHDAQEHVRRLRLRSQESFEHRVLASPKASKVVAGRVGQLQPLRVDEARKANVAFVDMLRAMAKRRTTPARLTPAWLLAQKPWIVPIPGTRKLERLDESLGAADLSLTPEEFREIKSAASEITLQGARYPEYLQKLVADEHTGGVCGE